MEMHQVRYFLAVCEALNFTRASEKCNISQPALTKAIQRFEEDLGDHLFDRSKNTVSLTEFGQLMLPTLKELYEVACKAKTRAQTLTSTKTRRLKIGIMCTIGFRRLVKFLIEFEAKHPKLHFSYEEGTLTELHDRLDKHEIDLAIGSNPYELPKRFCCTPLFKENFHIAFSAGHKFEKLKRIPMCEMDGQPYVSRRNCEYSDLLSDMMAKQGVGVIVKHETPREDWIQEMVLAGMGLAYIAESTPLHKNLLTRAVCDPSVTRTINLLSVADRVLTPEMKEFIVAATTFDWSAP